MLAHPPILTLSRSISMNIYVPTYLYIKQHSITGLKYFGKTIKKDPVKYLGSGTYWKNHIKKHGKEFVETIWYQKFDDFETLTNFAKLFSDENNITESKGWANLSPENGLDGAAPGRKHSNKTKYLMSIKQKGIPQGPKSSEHCARISQGKMGKSTGPRSEETKLKISNKLKGRKHSDEHKLKNSEGQKGKKMSYETKLKLSTSNKGRPPTIQPILSCPHCGKTGNKGNMNRWHFNNCRLQNINTLGK